MKKRILITTLILIIACKAEEAQQQQTPETTVPQKPQVIYVPVPVQQAAHQQNPKLTESQKDEILFCDLLNILGNFGQVFLNKDDTPTVLQGVSNIISGIVSAFHTIITKRNPTETKKMMIRALREYSNQLEKTL